MSIRTPLDSERPKLSVDLCREALSHSGTQELDSAGFPPPPLVAFSFGDKEGAGERGLLLGGLLVVKSVACMEKIVTSILFLFYWVTLPNGSGRRFPRTGDRFLCKAGKKC